jgi:hypothetical protein
MVEQANQAWLKRRHHAFWWVGRYFYFTLFWGEGCGVQLCMIAKHLNLSLNFLNHLFLHFISLSSAAFISLSFTFNLNFPLPSPIKAIT